MSKFRKIFVPNVILDVQERTTLLVSGGNDSLIKVWKISLIRDTMKLSRYTIKSSELIELSMMPLFASYMPPDLVSGECRQLLTEL